jgi:hypothetical protein
MKLRNYFLLIPLILISEFGYGQNKPIFEISASTGVVIPLRGTNAMYYNLLNPGPALELNGSIQFNRIGFTLAIAQNKTGILNNQRYLDLDIYDEINFIRNPSRSTLMASLRARVQMELSERFKLFGFVGAGYGKVEYSPFEIKAYVKASEYDSYYIELDYSAEALKCDGILAELGIELQYQLKDNLGAHFRLSQQALGYMVPPTYYLTHAEPVRKYQLASQNIIQLGVNYRFD